MTRLRRFLLQPVPLTGRIALLAFFLYYFARYIEAKTQAWEMASVAFQLDSIITRLYK